MATAKKVKIPKGIGTVVVLSLILVMGTVTLLCSFSAISKGAESLRERYDEAVSSRQDEVYKEFYDFSFQQAEAAYHVSNRAAISIGNIQEIAKLEVLKVSDIEYVILKENGNEIWLEVPGSGMYVVDLEAAEFLVDNERQFVLVRIPAPEVQNITIDYAGVKKLFFKNNKLDSSVKAGEEYAIQMLKSADSLIRKEFLSNQEFFKRAQTAAINAVQCLVKQLNPDIPDLTVTVEFF